MLMSSRFTHLRYGRYLDAHVDGELRGAFAAAVREHVARCRMCGHASRTTMLIKQRLALRRQF